MTENAGYAAALAAERSLYENCLNVHDLPPIFHYWSNQYLRPKLLPFGLESPNDLFFQCLVKHVGAKDQGSAHFASLGCGNCELEIDLCRQLLAAGHRDFLIECHDLNPVMLARGQQSASEAGVDTWLRFQETDLNHWEPFDTSGRFDAVFANQSLHHLVKLEDLFDRIKAALVPGGSFAVADMIGRNGHQRWPEALRIVYELWSELPPSYRFNHALRRYEQVFEDWDCSTEHFEGIRAQDILPLLCARFNFRLFIPFGNLIDPFIDRTFGPNFDPANPWARDFLDRVQQRDDREITAGNLKPTHMLAILSPPDEAGKQAEPGRYPGSLSPRFCIRWPELVHPPAPPAPLPYACNLPSHQASAELKRLCDRLQALPPNLEITRELQDTRTWTARLKDELDEKCRTVRDLQQELRERTDWALQLDQEVASVRGEAAAAWARAAALEAEVEQRTEWSHQLDRELAEMSSHVVRLTKQLEEHAGRARALEAERAGYFRNPLRYTLQYSARVLRKLQARFRGARA